jgi:glycosyltransferase involved in cell wall biosynthesis
MEAMACGLPTIATGWGGNTAFMNAENSYLLDSSLVPVPERGWREVPTYKGHRWAEPDSEQLQKTMRRVFEYPKEAAAIAKAAREQILSRYGREAVGPLIADQLAKATATVVPIDDRETDAGFSALVAAPAARNDVSGAAARVRWEGAFFRQHSLGHVNRELCAALMDRGAELSILPTEPPDTSPGGDLRLQKLAEASFAPLSGPAHVHVRHSFPPLFAQPDEGHFVLMQPWEYGYIPKEWVAKIGTMVSEVWCNSRYVMDVYKNSGVPEEKLACTPLGVDTSILNPNALPYIFTDEAGAARMYGRQRKDPFVFLYVGGTIERKGFDILLDAYLKAFSAYDDVVLVIKATGTKSVYSDSDHSERLTALAADASRPRIVYLDNDLTAREMAGIYTAADCLVAPYRGEGFCLPVLEAMACGVPSIVTSGGSTDDFVDDETGWRVPAKRKPFGDGRVGEWECAGPTWMFEVSGDDLAKSMREVARDEEECKRRGAAGARRVEENWTWRHSAAIVHERITALKERPVNKPLQAAKPAVTAPNVSLAGEKKQKNKRGAAIGKRKPTISLCMIVKNEERVLGDCLTSIKPWVDEIIVIDTGSTDRTVEIAKGHGAKVHHFPWTKSFSAARNESLKYATGDWILWMDADDTIPPECGAGLRDATLLAEEKVCGLMMQVRIPPAPGEVGQTVVDHVKLFRNGMGLKFEGRIHEQILEPIYKAGGEIRRTDMYVVHSGYDYSIEGQKQKRARDLSLLELDLSERPDHPFVLFNIGMTAFHMKDFAKAVTALEKCLSLSKPGESTVRKVYAMLAGSALETGDLIGARRWIEQGLSLFPRDPELLFRGGIVYKEIGSLAKAEECYLKLLKEPETGHIDSIDTTMTGFKAHHNLALVYRDMGELTGAARHFEEAIKKAPYFEPSMIGLKEVAIAISTERSTLTV